MFPLIPAGQSLEFDITLSLMPIDAGVQSWEPAMEEQWRCVHRLDRQGTVMCNIGCPSSQSEPVSIYICELFGQVTLSKRRTELTRCAGCGNCKE